jgi:hypothetical protein
MADSTVPNSGTPVSGGPNEPKEARADYNKDGTTDEKDLDLQKFDKNKDGKLDKGEQAQANKADEKEFRRDRLEADLMNSEFSWAWKLIKSVPELEDLWRQAIDDGWESPRFIAKLIDSDWYQENDGYRRTILALEKTDQQTYQRRLDGAKARVKDDLIAMGIRIEDIPESRLSQLGRNFLLLGFDQGQNESVYQDWLGSNFMKARESGKGIGGKALSNQDALTAVLLANGFDPKSERWQSWITSTVNSVSVGDMALSDAQSFVREQAATAFPVFADRIRQGQDMQDIAAAYFEIYADTLELNPSEISLRDPYMREALQGVDRETGQPRAMGLWDFQKALRKDERWQYTKQANSMTDGLAADILTMFGFVG